MTSTAPGTAPLPELVVRWLGRVAITGLLGGGCLIALAIMQPGKIDPTVVAVIGTYLGIATLTAGGLCAILASTRSVEPVPPGSVTVTPTSSDDSPSGVTVTAATTTVDPPTDAAPRTRRTRRPK